MVNFNKNSRFRGNDRGGDRGRPEMHEATCDDCGRNCEVPFKPSGGKPIFCSNCFKKDDSPRRDDRGGRSDRRHDDRGRGRDDRGRPDMHSAVCADCGKNCEVPFRPSSDKPVFCNNCFGKDSGAVGKFKKPKENLDKINAKLDRILFLLEGTPPTKEDKKAAKKAAKEAKKEAKVEIEELVFDKPVKKVAVKKKAVVKKAQKKAPAKKKTQKK